MGQTEVIRQQGEIRAVGVHLADWCERLPTLN